MDIAFKLVFWLHLLSLALGGAASFGIPALLGLAMKAEPAQRPVFGMAMMRLAAVGRMAVVLLVLTGLTLVWLMGGTAGFPVWFWLKMLLVTGLIALLVVNTWNGAKMRKGDAAAVARAPVLAKIGMATLAGIVLTAVLAFS